MAEINNQPSQQTHKRTQCKKKSTRVDLTSMVDLGFILVTFFVFTATLSKPMAMNLAVPNDTDKAVEDLLCESCVLTVLLDSGNNIWYYEGNESYGKQKQVHYDPGGLRQLIQEKKKAVLRKRGTDQFVLIVKPGPQSSFKNLVTIIDECAINGVKRYYIDEVKPIDNAWLNREKINSL